MSWLQRGKGKTDFNKFKTYEYERVQQRLDSVLPAVESKVEQALAVDSARVILFKKVKFGLLCSCNGVENHEQDMDEGYEKGIQDHGSAVRIKGTRNGGMFGMGSASISLDDIEPGTANAMDQADIMSGQEDEYAVMRPQQGNNVNCGICYRQGVQPGYSAAGFLYNVCSHHHVQKLVGYTQDQGTAPTSFTAVTDGGYVDFGTLVPMFFKHARYSVRCNERLLEAWPRPQIVVGDEVMDLTHANLERFKGRDVTIRVRGHEQFSHLVLIFDQGLPQVNGNLSEEANILSYDEELTVGNLTVVLPSRIGMVEPEDILSIPFKNYVLKVTDAPKKRTAKNEQWEWVCVCRAVQRKEVLFNIDKGFDIK